MQNGMNSQAVTPKVVDDNPRQPVHPEVLATIERFVPAGYVARVTLKGQEDGRPELCVEFRDYSERRLGGISLYSQVMPVRRAAEEVAEQDAALMARAQAGEDVADERWELHFRHVRTTKVSGSGSIESLDDTFSYAQALSQVAACGMAMDTVLPKLFGR